MRLVLAAVMALGLALPACSGNGTGGGCGPAPATLAIVPSVAKAFPAPPGLSIIGVEHKTPVTEIIAAVQADLGQAFDGYRRALAAAGYLVRNPQRGSDFARLEFSGSSTIGTVHLVPECPGRIDVTVSITTAAGPA